MMRQTVVGVDTGVGVGSVAVGVRGVVVSSISSIGVGVSSIVRVPRVGLGISLSSRRRSSSGDNSEVGESGENSMSAGYESSFIISTAGSSGSVDERRVVVSQRVVVSVGEGMSD